MSEKRIFRHVRKKKSSIFLPQIFHFIIAAAVARD